MLSWRLRLVYAIGQMPEGIKTAAFGFFLLFYYNQVLGLSGSLAGMALFVALLFDAVSDPLVGSISDYFRSRFGRRHPFMVLAAIPFALSFLGLFLPPNGLSETGLFLWLTTFAVLTRTFMTFYQVPYLALGAELTQHYDERTLLAALRNVFQLIGMFAVLIGGNLLFFGATDEFANGQLNPAAYGPFTLACLPLMVAGIWFAAFGTAGRIQSLESAPPRGGAVFRRALRDLRQAFSFPSFVALVCAAILFGINQGMVQALHLYLATYFFELSSGQVTFLFAGAIIGIVVGSLLSRPLARFIPEKRYLFMAGSIWYAMWTSSIIILRLLDWLPGNEDPIVAVLYIGTGCISAIGLGAAIPMLGSMTADITDQHELRYGTRQEGIYYAASSFAGKAVGGAGPILAGVIIDASGIAPGSLPSDVDPAAIARFGWATGPSVVLLSCLSAACLFGYGLSRMKHADILAELRSRRSA